MEYYIYITNDCNMNCAYCSVLFDTAKYCVPLNPQYSFEDLERFITKTQRDYKDKVADLYFFGGEPTINYRKIEELIEAFGIPHDYQINYIMHTNGILIPEAPDNIIKHLHLTVLSFNYELIYTNGRLTPYFGKMVHSIEHIKSIKRIPIIGRITVSPKTSLFTECCLISNYVDYVYWQIDNCESIDDYASYKSQYIYEVELLFKYWLDCLRKGVFIRLVPFMSAIQKLINEPAKPTDFYCGYGTSMIYIQTNGKCYACCDNISSDSHYIGNIYSGVSFSKNNLCNTICNDCEYIKLCGGRCGRMHKDFTIDRIKQYCELNQYMFNIIIENKSEILEMISKDQSIYAKINDPMISYTEYTA